MIIDGRSFDVYECREDTFMLLPKTEERIEFLQNISNSGKPVSIDFVGNKSTNMLRLRQEMPLGRIFKIDLL